MLTNNQILHIATTAADVAAAVLGVEDFKYSVGLINDPAFTEDALFNTQENKVLINMAQLHPFPQECAESASENVRLVFKVIYLTYHEMRHAYQKKALEIYTINQMLGSGTLPMVESKKKCELWLSEMKGNPSDPFQVGGTIESDCEQDAEAFAWYLLSRSPIRIPLTRTNKHIGIMKRKYDKVEVPDLWNKPSTDQDSSTPE